MANPIIKIKRGATAPTTLNQGELAVDLTNKNLYVGDLSGAPLAIGGEGTFAKKNASDVGFTGGNIDGVTIGSTTAAGGAFTTLTASTAPTTDNDVVRLKELNAAVSDLGSVFHYVGDVSDTDLDAMSDITTGAYYRVITDGVYTADSGATTFNAKDGDAFVKTTTGWQKLDNVDAVVLGTTNEISVSGNEDIGYTVSLASGATAFKTIVENKIQNIDQNGTIAGTTTFTGNLAGDGTTSQITDFIIDGGTY